MENNREVNIIIEPDIEDEESDTDAEDEEQITEQEALVRYTLTLEVMGTAAANN
jgi:hypothetical protein